MKKAPILYEKGGEGTLKKRGEKTMIRWKKKMAAYLSLVLLAGVICACGGVSSDQDQTPTEKEETTTDFDSTDETEETLLEPETIDEIKESAVEPETIKETEESAIEIETESETETILPESEAAATEEMGISEMDALMYAQANVNIRASYSADSEKLGTLQKGTSIKVTGVTADQNWYMVEYKEAEAFISASYLGLEKPAEEAPAPAIETPAPEAFAGTQDTSELTGQALEDYLLDTETYDINSIPIEDDGLTAEERAEKYEHMEDPTGILGQLHAG